MAVHIDVSALCRTQTTHTYTLVRMYWCVLSFFPRYYQERGTDGNRALADKADLALLRSNCMSYPAGDWLAAGVQEDAKEDLAQARRARGGEGAAGAGGIGNSQGGVGAGGARGEGGDQIPGTKR